MGLWITLAVAVAVVLGLAALADAHHRRLGVVVDADEVHRRRKEDGRSLRRSLLPGARRQVDKDRRPR